MSEPKETNQGVALARIIHVFKTRKASFMVKSRCLRGFRPIGRLSHGRTYHNTVCNVPGNF